MATAQLFPTKPHFIKVLLPQSHHTEGLSFPLQGTHSDNVPNTDRTFILVRILSLIPVEGKQQFLGKTQTTLTLACISQG